MTTNTTAPGSGAPWNHVGTIGGASGVYLGAFGDGYWVLTAAHVGLGNITLNRVTYTAVSGSGVQIGARTCSRIAFPGTPACRNSCCLPSHRRRART